MSKKKKGEAPQEAPQVIAEPVPTEWKATIVEIGDVVDFEENVKLRRILHALERQGYDIHQIVPMDQMKVLVVVRKRRKGKDLL